MNTKLSELLKLHDSAKSSASLPKSLGDAYLHQHNPVYRSIRAEFLRLGYSYTTEDFCHYTVLPYASLGAILEKRKVPYFDNVSVLREIESKHPGKFLVDELVQVKSNYVLHEASHCVAHELLKGLVLDAKGSTAKSLSAEESKALRLMMTESFANSVEALANTFNGTPELRFFHSVNSYCIHDKKAAVSFKQAIDLVGIKAAFRLLFVAYLYSNCLHSELSRTQFQDLLTLTLDDVEVLRKALDSPHVRKLVYYAFELNSDFRFQTSGFYLAYSGLALDVRKLSQIDLLGILRGAPSMRDFLQKTQNFF